MWGWGPGERGPATEVAGLRSARARPCARLRRGSVYCLQPHHTRHLPPRPPPRDWGTTVLVQSISSFDEVLVLMSRPVTMEDVCHYWLGFIHSTNIYLSVSHIDHSKLPDFLFMFYLVYVYSIQELTSWIFCLIMHVAHLQNISENAINVKALQVHILWHETHDSMSTICKCSIMNDRKKGPLVVHLSCWNFLDPIGSLVSTLLISR